MKKQLTIKLIYAVLFSILIGLVTSTLLGAPLNRSWVSHLWNMGYSVSLGVPLFAIGYLFEWYEKRYIDWIKSPVKSVLAALSLHLIYSSVVIFSVNWFWFIVVLGRNWGTFGGNNRATIISEYIRLYID